MKQNGKVHNRIFAFVNVVIYTVCALCLVFTVLSSRNNEGAVKLFGYEMLIVLSGSMEKNSDVDVSNYRIKDIKTGSMVFVQTVPEQNFQAKEWYSRLQVGDVLTFRYVVGTRQETVTHRIVALEAKDTGGYLITLRGDNVVAGEQLIDTDIDGYNYVIGKVTGKSFVFGWLAYWLKRPVGIMLLVVLPCLIVVFYQVARIVNIVTDKNKTVEFTH